MATRKRRAKEVEKEEVKVTKRGRRVKKVNYDDIFSDSSSSEEMIDTRKRKQEDSDQEFNVDVGPQESSSEESVYSENSEPVNDLANEGSVGKKKKPQAKGKPKASIKNPKEEIKMKANDSTTNVSCGGLSRSSNQMIPTIIKNPRTPKKTPFGLDEDVEEIDGQKVPDFIRKEFIRDKNLKKPDDIEYDPSTVDIPKEMYDKLTPMQKQYWDIKRDHFDSVVLWRKGDWYIVLYHDIHALNSTSDSLPRTFHNEPGFYQNK